MATTSCSECQFSARNRRKTLPEPHRVTGDTLGITDVSRYLMAARLLPWGYHNIALSLFATMDGDDDFQDDFSAAAAGNQRAKAPSSCTPQLTYPARRPIKNGTARAGFPATSNYGQNLLPSKAMVSGRWLSPAACRYSLQCTGQGPSQATKSRLHSRHGRLCRR